MHIPGMNLDLEVRKKGHISTAVAQGVEKMLRAVIPNGTNGHGRWLLKVDDICKSLQDCREYRLEVKLSDEANILLDVAARSSLVDEPVRGTLRLAPGISRYELLDAMAPVIERLNQEYWHGVLGSEAGDLRATQAGGVVKSSVLSTPSSEGSAMNAVIQADVGIQVSLEDAQMLPSETNRRLAPMLEGLLAKARAPHGQYHFACRGRYKPFESLAYAYVEVEMGGQSDALAVRMRTRGGQLGSVYGNLRLPAGVERGELFRAIQGVLEDLNKSKWEEVLHNISPEPHPERQKSVWEPPSSHVASSTPPAQLPVAPTSSTQPGSVVGEDVSQTDSVKSLLASPLARMVEQATIPVTDKAANKEQERIKFLLTVLDQAPSGVFFWRDTKKAQELITGNRIGLSQLLQGLHWIATTARPGQYRITDTFLRAHAPTFKLTLSAEAESHSAGKVEDGVPPAHEEQDTTSRAMPTTTPPPSPPTSSVPRAQSEISEGDGTMSTSNVTDLLSQRRAIDDELRRRLEERRIRAAQLEDELAQVKQEVAAIEAALGPLQ